MKNGKKNITLKNGLTEAQVQTAKDILAQVNRVKVCQDTGVPVMTVVNVLRGSSPRIDLLVLVVDRAKEMIADRQELCKKIKA